MDKGRVLSIFSIPVYIHPSWYFTAALITYALANGDVSLRHPGLPVFAYWIYGAAAALSLFACVLLHELGHSFAARGFGVPVHRVTLFIFGGVATIGHEARRPSVELLIAFAGPLVSFGLAFLFINAVRLPVFAEPGMGLAESLLNYLISVNIGVLLFNLLPGFPLDGGRILRAFLWMVSRNILWATRIASGIGIALGIVLILLGAWDLWVSRSWTSGLWAILLGSYLQSSAYAVFLQTGTGSRP